MILHKSFHLKILSHSKDHLIQFIQIGNKFIQNHLEKSINNI